MAESNQRFDTFQEWVNFAPRWIGQRDEYALCFDAKGRQCKIGGDFMRARDENVFPVYWIWPSQMPNLFALATSLAETDMKDVGFNGAPHLLDNKIEEAKRVLSWQTK